MSLSTESQSGTRWQRVVLATSRWWCSPKPNGVSPTRSAPCKQLNWTKHQSGNKRTFKVVISKISMSISLATPMAITEKILVDVTNSICVLTDVIINFSGTYKSKRELHLFFLTDIYLHGNFQGYYFKSKPVIFILTAKNCFYVPVRSRFSLQTHHYSPACTAQRSSLLDLTLRANTEWFPCGDISQRRGAEASHEKERAARRVLALRHVFKEARDEMCFCRAVMSRGSGWRCSAVSFNATENISAWWNF